MTQNRTVPPATNRLSKQRRYRRLMVGSLLGGVGLSLALRVLDYPLAGEAVYWLGVLGFLAVWFGTSVTLFDERDRALERRASQLALLALAPVLVVGASAARVLPLVSDYAVPAAVWPALYAYVSVYVVFGVAYAWVRSGR
ncbi:DUF2178 domain-containing protein [Halomarina ordinaria]|uniref:DUF2178 domain-containing protein n=1 Tax=Halomarina ordinaria TaxID=3033939 RepID=A0ABD5UCG8_9EURY|nr:DUF2178 domain-containing protein [Halomarina sp. PSRA2]